ncbi:hypothetical protein G4O51_09040 [Candidatus Bathyarchaeota archaeon A05DMB-2]|jgi:hypothetical protein|nr:hypothetical protein [Candidatus Bathyarchaeota archaeon A05DMB-2]
MPACDKRHRLLVVFGSVRKELSGKLWKNDLLLADTWRCFGAPEAEATKTWYRGWEEYSGFILSASVFGYPQARF